MEPTITPIDATLGAVVTGVRGPAPAAVAAAITAALVLWRHRSNLRRILGGRERRMGAPRS